jgi:predicted DNA-binding transcriptional regulator AlpA
VNRPTTGGSALRQTPLNTESARRTVHQSAAQPPALVLLDAKQAAGVLGISERKFHELRASKATWLPLPIALGPRLLRWPRAELEAAVVAAPRVEGADEPESLAVARRRRIDAMKGATQTRSGAES